jgi:SAM-dependent methyltransferase
MASASHGDLPASAWVQRWSPLVAPGGSVLDVACGRGRHLRWFAARGCRVSGVDRDAAGLQAQQGIGELVVADLENGPWPLPGRRFDAVVVTNYLWRALMPTLVESVAEGGVLIYETFAYGNASVGKPSNPHFLLQPGELLHLAQGLRIVAFEDGFLGAPERFVQRVAAVRERAGATAPPRYPL